MKILSNRRGFTLLELLIAITLLAAMLGIIAGGFHLSIRAWEAGGKRLENRQELTESVNLLKRLIKSAMPVMYIADRDKNQNRIAFIGEEESATFVTAAPRLHPPEDAAGFLFVQRVEFLPAVYGLSFKEARFDPSKKPDDYEWIEMIVGKESIRSFRFEYFVKNPKAEAGGGKSEKYIWTDTANSDRDGAWKKTGNLPQAVRIRLEVLDSPDNFVWPDQLVPLYRNAVIEMVSK
ncbi:MAG: hypothetical protein IEMM0002_1360 [bacterium]|nr:MAG: hypothetical protein IEMM0002_1360 [bacterium]